MTFVHIMVHIIAPVFVLMAVGAIVERRLGLDLDTMSRLNFYIFVPALVLWKLAEAELDPSLEIKVALFAAAHLLLMAAASRLVFRPARHEDGAVVLQLAAMLYNAGNYGLPFALLAFGDIGASAMAIVVVTQNLLTFSLGIWMLESAAAEQRRSLSDRCRAAARSLIGVPVVWAVLIGMTLRLAHQTLPDFLMEPLRHLGRGLIPVALITLGAQLARAPAVERASEVMALTAVRLVGSPLLAALMVRFWPAPLGEVAPVLIVGAGLPVAVNVYVLALEYRQRPELASQLVFWSTLVSAVTVSVAVRLAA